MIADTERATPSRIRMLWTGLITASFMLTACGGDSTSPVGPADDGSNEPDDSPQPSFFGEWEARSDLGGVARDRGVAISIRDRGYVGLGQSEGDVLDDFWEYDPESDTWTQVADFAGGPRRGAAGFSIGGMGYIGTGYQPRIHLRDFWAYDPETNEWTRVADFGGDGRRGASGFALQGKGYLGTGSVKPSDGQVSDFWEYDPVSDSWTQRADVPGPRRYFAYAFALDFAFSDVHGDRGYIGGGWGEVAPQAFRDLWIYDPTTDDWNQGPNLPASGRVWATAFSVNGKGYVGLGHTGQQGGAEGSRFLDDFFEYDPGPNQWNAVASWPASRRMAPVAFSVGDRGYVGTGWDGELQHRDLQEFTPPSDP